MMRLLFKSYQLNENRQLLLLHSLHSIHLAILHSTDLLNIKVIMKSFHFSLQTFVSDVLIW